MVHPSAREPLAWLLDVMRAADTPDLVEQARQVLAALRRDPRIVAAGLWCGDTHASRCLGQHNLDETALAPLVAEVLANGQALTRPAPFGDAAELSLLPLCYAEATFGVLAIVAQPREPADMLRWRVVAAHLGASLWPAQQPQQTEQALSNEWDDFIAHAVHEIKNPLASTKGYADLLLRRANKDSNENYRKGLVVISQQVTKANGLLEQLSDTSRINTNRIHIEPSYADLADVTRRVAQEQQIKTDQHLIDIEGVAEALYTTFDVARISQCLEAIIGNAVKFSPNGGTISIGLSEQPQPGGSSAAVVSVSDQGIGVPAAERERIFERFKRGSNVVGLFSGLGLGLFIARDLVQRHGGRMWVAGEPDQGTTVFLLLPLRRR